MGNLFVSKWMLWAGVFATASFGSYFASAAPLSPNVDPRAPNVVELIGEIERWKAENRDGKAEHFDELFAVRCYFAMGSTATALKKLDQVEAVAATIADPRRKLETYCQIAELVARSDPARARRLLGASEKILAEMTDHKRYPVRDLIYGYSAVGDDRKAVDIAFAAADAEEHAYAAMNNYEDLALMLTSRKAPELSAEVQKRIRELQPRAKEFGFTDWLEDGRTRALTAAGLPDEAAARFAAELAARPADAENVGDSIMFGSIAISYLYVERRADALEYVKQARRLLPPDEQRWLAVAAAEAGDFDLALSLLEKAEFGAPAQANTLAVMAHRAGKFALRDECLARARRGYDAASDELKKEEQVDVAGDLATVEALLGRFEPLVRLLPERPEAEGMRFRALLIMAILRKQGMPVLYHGHDMLDAEFGLGG